MVVRERRDTEWEYRQPSSTHTSPLGPETSTPPRALGPGPLLLRHPRRRRRPRVPVPLPEPQVLLDTPVRESGLPLGRYDWGPDARGGVLRLEKPGTREFSLEDLRSYPVPSPVRRDRTQVKGRREVVWTKESGCHG